MGDDTNGTEVPSQLAELRSFYRCDEPIAISGIAGHVAIARSARGEATVIEDETALAPGTYAIELRDQTGRVVAEDFTTVAAHPGQRPVHGFATTFDGDVAETVAWLGKLRCTVVQCYDWMHRYAAPLGPEVGWRDPSDRPVSLQSLSSLAAGIRALGAVAHAYAPIYAVDLDFADQRPELLMYQDDGAPQRFFEMIKLADPASQPWRSHFARTYGEAADRIGFNGFHIDTYGYPRAPLDAARSEIDVRSAYEGFLDYFRSQRPDDLISFNQVNGVPSAVRLPAGPTFRYCEVWAPNDGWRHLEALMDRSSGHAGRLGQPTSPGDDLRGSIACYPPVWGKEGGAEDHREERLRTVVITGAVAVLLGASALLYGDRTAVLFDPYYPKHERLSPGEAAMALRWHRFGLRCRDLFIEGEDTSWYEIGDDNGAVAVVWDGPARPEPVAGSVFARVVRGERCVSVGVLDLTGSAAGRWSDPTAPGSCRSVRVRALVNDPQEWAAHAAVLGRGGDRFEPVATSLVAHREGVAIELELPVDLGWSVVRLTR